MNDKLHAQAEAHEADDARYQQYRPQHLQLGFPHPDCIVESTSLAAVRAPRIYTDVSALQVGLHPLLRGPPAAAPAIVTQTCCTIAGGLGGAGAQQRAARDRRVRSAAVCGQAAA